MISDPRKKESEQVASDLIDLILSRVHSYCTADPLADLTSRNKLEPYFEGSKEQFRVMSYNVMAHSLSHHNLENIKPFEERYLKWEYRSSLFLKEIRYYDPDILCLQEVDKDDNTIAAALQDDYHIFYKSRTGDKGDGCMTLIKKSKYDIIERHFIEYFRDPNDPILNRDNVCIITVVKPKEGETKDLFFIANTHILFSDNRGDIKTAQVTLALKALKKLSQAERFRGYHHHFFYMGDFNLLPNSGIYELLSKGRFDFREQRCNLLTGQKLGALKNVDKFRSIEDFLIANINHYRYDSRNIENKRELLLQWLLYLKRIDVDVRVPVNDEPCQIGFVINDPPPEEINPLDESIYCLETDLRLLSTYGNFQKFYYGLKHQPFPSQFYLPKYSTYEPVYTCRTINSLMTVDYIWFSSASSNGNRKLRVRSVYEVPSYHKVKRVFYYPNRIFPSDHFSLIADFELL